MFDPVTAIASSTAAVAGANILSGVIGSDSSRYAANTQADANRYASDLQYRAGQDSLDFSKLQWQTAQDQQKPWITAGTTNVNLLADLMKPGGQLYQTTPTLEQLQMDPSYVWRKQQGIDALAAAGAAAGNYGSGNMGIALETYGQNLASTEYQNAYNRWVGGQTDLYNRIAGLSGTGQQTAANLGSLGSAYSNTIGNTLTGTANAMGQYGVGAANAQGAGAIGQANAWSGAMTGMGNQLMAGLGSYMNYQQNQNLINALMNRNPTGYGYGQDYGIQQQGWNWNDAMSGSYSSGYANI